MGRESGISDTMALLDGDALTRIRRLELIARDVVEGFVSGRHRSPAKGFSSEFAEHREYSPGDNVRDLDWRVYGRTDRYYVKQYIEETNLRATVLLDASGSMAYRGTRAQKRDGEILSKFEYARYLAASLAYLLVNQQDAVGLVTFDTAIRRYIPPRARRTHLRFLLEELNRTVPGGETDLAPVFHDIAETLHRRGLVMIVSDLFGDTASLVKALQHFRFKKHEVVLFHVMAEEELDFPFDRWSQFTDLEDASNSLSVDPAAIRAAYLKELREFIETLKAACGRMRIDYVQMSTRTSFDKALSHYLVHRKRLASVAGRGGSAR
jgi:uncharacterized protein (DUF58 family)